MKTHGVNILVADDDASIREFVQAALEKLGHTVMTAEDGKDAIDLFAARPDFFQVVITDHNMPVVNGLELVQHLRQHNFKGKIIVASGFLTEELTMEYILKHVNNVIEKPFNIESFEKTIDDLLDEGRVK